jgi:hypothetical protein
MEDEVETIDLSTINDFGGSHSRDNKRAPTKYRQSKQEHVDPENEPDPDWIEFDPEKETSKFFGHVMKDEEKLRQKVVTEKEKRKAREEDRKKKALDAAKKTALSKLE